MILIEMVFIKKKITNKKKYIYRERERDENRFDYYI